MISNHCNFVVDVQLPREQRRADNAVDVTSAEVLVDLIVPAVN
jgi:hypothetical protein